MTIRIGTSGFSFLDWKGPVYPKELKTAEMLSYYAGDLKFNSVEVNFTYYALPSEKSFMGMQKKVPKEFVFTVKGNRGTTHDPFDPRIIRKPSIMQAFEDTKKFAVALKPLIAENQLGCVLLQFPFFFNPSEESKEYIVKCRDILKDIPLVIEFRSAEWAKPETLTFLSGNKLGFCAVDEPKLNRLMPYMPEVTSKTGYLRFHGRNNNWFNAPMEERYNYLYSEPELKSFLPDIKKMAGRCKDLFLFFNNCHLGSAVKNADNLRKLLIEYLGAAA
ncbi:MAG: DUF72 domain-containing protein [Candidatus Firestonebacteria bacterium]|nr:DUF72 domain-containing protein [Candidatus Firestonebacteria bacterium]